LLSIAALWVACSGSVAAQALPTEAEPEKQVHWALGAFFGTGWYQVDDNRSVFVLRIPPRQQVREAALGEDGSRRIGVEVLYPVALGLSQLEEVPDFVAFDNYASISFTPGVELEVPVTPEWTLRPYLHLGYGWEKESSDGAVIWYGGVKSRYRMAAERHRWSWLGEAYFAGYRPEYEGRGRYSAVMAGIEWEQPLGRLELGGEPLYLEWHLTYDWFFDELKFHVDRDTVETVSDQWELGLAFGRSDHPIELGFLSFDHVGLAYRWSSNGTFDAIVLNFTSPFLN
jgi:hypothetical protein